MPVFVKSFSKMHSLCLLPLCTQNFPMYLLRVMNFYLSVGLWPVLGKNYFGASETCVSWMQVTKAIENVTAVENCLFWLSKRLSSEIQDLLGQSPKNRVLTDTVTEVVYSVDNSYHKFSSQWICPRINRMLSFHWTRTTTRANSQWGTEPLQGCKGV